MQLQSQLKREKIVGIIAYCPNHLVASAVKILSDFSKNESALFILLQLKLYIKV